MLGDSLTIPYTVLEDCFNHWTHLRSQPRSRNRRPFPTLCSGTARPPSTFVFPIALGDLSITLYAVLGDCSNHSWIIAWRLLCLVTYEFDSYTTKRCYFFRPYYKAYFLHSRKLRDYISTMHLVVHLSIRFLMPIFRLWYHEPMSPTTRLED
jgi:hypothetical protein